MKKEHRILGRCPLFAGIAEAEIEKILDCLGARTRKYEKNAFIFMEDDKLSSMGIVLSGGIHIVREDYWGGRVIVEHFMPGDLFAEAFSLAEARLPVSVMASEESEILLLEGKKIISTCASACVFHIRLVQNIIHSLAGKNMLLVKKMDILSRKTTREKLLAYLSAQAMQTKTSAFEIPFKRQELADYLSVDRSAMSAELCRMRDEGILKFHKCHFELLRREKE